MSLAASSRLKKPWVQISMAIVLGGLAAIAIWPQVFGPQIPDIGDLHDQLVLVRDLSAQGSSWNLYSLFYVLVYVLSLGSKNFDVIAGAGIVVLMASVVAKGMLSYFVIRKTSCGQLCAALASVALVLVMPLPNWWKPSEVYLDKIAPTIWFNSTTMLTMPFAILLFFATLKWLDRQTASSFLWVAAFSLLSILTKPNYVLAIVPVIGAFVAVKAGVYRNPQTIRAFLLYAGLTLALIGVLWLQYLNTFDSGPSTGKDASSIIFAPFAVWSLFSPNIPASLLLSVAFPLSVAVLYFKEIRHNASVTLAWAVCVFAVLQYLLLAESGDRFWDGNWGWGSNIAMYIVFLVSAAVVLAHPRSRRFYVVLTLFSLHLASGVFYYIKVALGMGFF